MDFPAAIFPSPLCPHLIKRELFAEYGMLSAVNLNQDGTFQPQKRCSAMPSQVPAKSKLLIKHKPDVPVSTDKFLQQQRDKLSKLTLIRKKLTVYERAFRNNSVMVKRLRNILKKMESWENSKRRSGENPLLNLPPWVEKLLTNKECLVSDSHIPAVNTLYNGGTMSYQQIKGHHLLLFPSGSDLDKLSIHNLTVDNDLQVENSVTYEQRHGAIYQVGAGPVKSGLGCLRTKSSCAVFRLGCDESAGLHMDASCLRPVVVTEREWPDNKPVAVCMNPYLAGESVLCLSDGSVLLWSIHNSVNVITRNHQPRFPCADAWRHCHFGSHPRLFVLSDRSGSLLMDNRIPGSACMDLLVLPNKHLHKNEQIFCAKANAAKPSCHLLATNYSLMCVDERFPNQPLLQWHHALVTPPQYLDVFSQSQTDEVILLGSQVEPEVICYNLGQNENNTPISTTVPWRLGIAANSGDITLRGMCGVPHKQGSGFTALQLTSQGDVFSQHVRSSDGHLLVQESDQTDGRESISSDAAEKSAHLDESQPVSPDTAPQEKNPAAVSIFAGLQLQSYPHIMCSFCMAYESHVTPDKEDEMCGVCGYRLGMSHGMRQATAKSRVISVPQTESLDVYLSPPDTRQTSGAYSQILLKLWNEEHHEIRDILLEKEKLEKIRKETEQKEKELEKSGFDVDDDGESADQNSEITLSFQQTSIPTDNVDNVNQQTEPAPRVSEHQRETEPISHQNIHQSENTLDMNSAVDESEARDLHRVTSPDSSVVSLDKQMPGTLDATSLRSKAVSKRKRHSSESSISSILSAASSSPGFLGNPKLSSPRKYPISAKKSVPTVTSFDSSERTIPKFNFFHSVQTAGESLQSDNSAKQRLSQTAAGKPPSGSPMKKKKRSFMGF